MGSMEIPDSRFPDSRVVLFGAIMIGASVGYFGGWVRSAFIKNRCNEN